MGDLRLPLRVLQMIDERWALEPDLRADLVLALDVLGDALGLDCTGALESEDDEGRRFYDHSGDTCPIHEWLVPADSTEGRLTPA